MGGTQAVIPGFAQTLGALTFVLSLGSADISAPVDEAATPSNAAESQAAELYAAERSATAQKLEYPRSARPAPLDSLTVVVRQAQAQSRSQNPSEAQGQSQPQARGRLRIEQRVFVRIAPRAVATRRNLLAQLPVRARRYEEKKPEKCVPVAQIAGVETGSGNRLLLFMRDAGIMSVNLEKACRARDFYAGFYVERNKDGKLCVARDTLQSRNGARCDIARMMELKALKD